MSDPDLPRPTQLAKTPPTYETVRSGVGLCLLSLGVVAVGVLIWATRGSLVQDSGWQTQSQAILIVLGTPLMALATLYFAYTSVRDWRMYRKFNAHKQRTNGIITHLWRGKDEAQKTTYYVGYQFGEHSAYQAIPKRRFNLLTTSMEIKVDYLPDDPTVSTIEWVRRGGKGRKM
jgi:hypothetical protein